MDEIEKRLRETSEHCFNCYESWQKDKKNSDVRETLLESIHEIRKVASRLEIEVAISERDENAQKPIPIPPHRDANRPGQGNEAEQGKGGSGGGNKNQKRKRAPKKAADA